MQTTKATELYAGADLHGNNVLNNGDILDAFVRLIFESRWYKQ